MFVTPNTILVRFKVNFLHIFLQIHVNDTIVHAFMYGVIQIDIHSIRERFSLYIASRNVVVPEVNAF